MEAKNETTCVLGYRDGSRIYEKGKYLLCKDGVWVERSGAGSVEVNSLLFLGKGPSG